MPTRSELKTALHRIANDTTPIGGEWDSETGDAYDMLTEFIDGNSRD